jgi:hypothetical protein
MIVPYSRVLEYRIARYVRVAEDRRSGEGQQDSAGSQVRTIAAPIAANPSRPDEQVTLAIPTETRSR